MPADAESNPELRPIQVVVVYQGGETGKRALRLLTGIVGNLGPEFGLAPLPWPFEILALPECAEAALRDTDNADILVIATGDTNPLPPRILQWLETVFNRKTGSVAAVVALLGPEESPDRPDSSRLKAIRQLARQAGLDFFAPGPTPNAPSGTRVPAILEVPGPNQMSCHPRSAQKLLTQPPP